MNIYYYKIYKKVYDDIVCRKKTIEFRLLNDKSKQIKKNDIIQFNVIDNEDINLKVKVIDKIIYNSFNDLWHHKDELKDNMICSKKEELKNLFYRIFGEKIYKDKIVGIKFELYNKNGRD